MRHRDTIVILVEMFENWAAGTGSRYHAAELCNMALDTIARDVNEERDAGETRQDCRAHSEGFSGENKIGREK